MVHLTGREKEQLKALIDAGEPLPARYRPVMFADPPAAELIWRWYLSLKAVLAFGSGSVLAIGFF